MRNKYDIRVYKDIQGRYIDNGIEHYRDCRFRMINSMGHGIFLYKLKYNINEKE